MATTLTACVTLMPELVALRRTVPAASAPILPGERIVMAPPLVDPSDVIVAEVVMSPLTPLSYWAVTEKRLALPATMGAEGSTNVMLVGEPRGTPEAVAGDASE